MKGLTKRQEEVLSFIEEYIEDRGYPPAVRDIAKHLNLVSAAGVHKHIRALVKKNYLTKADYLSRSLKVVHRPPSRPRQAAMVEMPLAGYVAAGQPIEAVQQDQETIKVPAHLLTVPEGNYVLRVRGESMIEEYIQDGDFVVMESRESAENGEMVVALINNQEATLKRLYREKDQIRLQPANSAMDPIYVRAADIRIQGVVVGIWRRYH